MKLDLNNKIIDYLKEHSGQKYTARQMAEWIFSAYNDECREKQKRSKATINVLNSDEALISQIIAEIGSNRPIIMKKEPKVKTTEGRPRKYYYTEKTDSDEVTVVELEEIRNSKLEEKLSERHLYPKLSQFLWSELNIYSKRIDEKRSSNTRGINGNRWLYPDIVGMENLSKDWVQEVRNCVQQYADKRTSLWSFEVKLLINRSNVRECFFQTVSNSSWANFAYLVASEIEGTDTLKELRILSTLHGIGFIKLDFENPSESQILIPAREKIEIDWDNVNRLATESHDFMEYINTIRRFYQTGDLKETDWNLSKEMD